MSPSPLPATPLRRGGLRGDACPPSIIHFIYHCGIQNERYEVDCKPHYNVPDVGHLFAHQLNEHLPLYELWKQDEHCREHDETDDDEALFNFAPDDEEEH